MKTLVVNGKKFASRLLILGFVIFVSVMFSTVPALATDFEFGTQFGISHLIPDGDDSTTSITYIRVPSSAFLDIGTSPTSLYATWFPNKQFAIGPEFSFGRVSVSKEYWGKTEKASITSLYLGGRAAYFLRTHAVSTPYVLGRVSTTILNGDSSSSDAGSTTLTSFGIGLGYQWRIGAAFVFRAEGQYQRLLLSDADNDANEFSLTIGVGTRFGSADNPAP